MARLGVLKHALRFAVYTLRVPFPTKGTHVRTCNTIVSHCRDWLFPAVFAAGRRLRCLLEMRLYPLAAVLNHGRKRAFDHVRIWRRTEGRLPSARQHAAL